jgi:hypothetical protein
MAATTQFRPLLTGDENLYIWQRINWRWLLQRVPMLLFAIVSSYGVGHLLHLRGVPWPIDYLGGITFDIGFLGVIALADQQLKKTTWSQVAYYLLNCAMSGLAALFNILSQSGGTYAAITAEHITVGAPFAIVGLCFAFYYHSVMQVHIEQELYKTAQNRYHCEYCNIGKSTKQAVWAHYKYCIEKLAGHAKKYSIE